MKIIGLMIGIFLSLSNLTRSFPQETDPWDRGYDLMREAYRLREEGEEETAREQLARALAFFRQTAADRVSLSVRPEVDFEIEKTPLGVNLIENRSLFKIEVRTGPPPPRDEPPPPGEDRAEEEAVLRLQQLIVQSLARVIQDNSELKASLARLESGSEETGVISDMVSEIKEETSEVTELSQTVSDIRDRSDDIYDEIERMAGDSDTLRAVEDLAGEISDLKDALDLLRDILDIVQDIKDDTAGISDLESQIEDVRSEVDNLGQ